MPVPDRVLWLKSSISTLFKRGRYLMSSSRRDKRLRDNSASPSRLLSSLKPFGVTCDEEMSIPLTPLSMHIAAKSVSLHAVSARSTYNELPRVVDVEIVPFNSLTNPDGSCPREEVNVTTANITPVVHRST